MGFACEDWTPSTKDDTFPIKPVKEDSNWAKDAIEITPDNLLVFNGLIFRIVDVIPIAFAEEKQAEVKIKIEGIKLR